MKPGILVWQVGQTYGVVVAKYLYVLKSADGVLTYGAESPVISVTNNGEVWSAISYPPHPHTLPPGAIPSKVKAAGRLQPEYRLPLEWAKKALAGAAHGTTVSIDAAQLAAVVSLPGPRGPISYAGFTKKVARASAHSLDALNAAISGCITKVESVWGWAPVNLEVKFHETTNAMGLAYNPGNKEHKISLGVRLLKSYSIDSVARVVLHEFCHHWREEHFPRSNNMHDSTFCRELERVDPLVVAHDGQACVKFFDQADPAIIAAAPKRQNRKEPIWSPNAGFILVKRLKSGHITLAWQGISGSKSGTWRAPLGDDVLLDLMKRFSPAQWEAVEVATPEMPIGSGLHGVGNLKRLIIAVLKGWPRLMGKSLAYLDALRNATVTDAT